MNSRERIISAIQHKQPDKVPIALGCGTDTGIHRIAYRNLLDYLGFHDREVQISILNQQLAYMDEDILKMFSIDTRGVFSREPVGYKVNITEDNEYYYFDDEFAISWRMPKAKPLYYDMYKHPLMDASFEDLKSFKWPDGSDKGRLSGMAAEAKEKFYNTEAALVVGPTIGGLLETFLFLQGFETGYYRLALEEKFSDYVLDQLLEIKLQYWCNLLDEVGEYTTIITESDDLGFQDRLAISPDMFKKYLKPRYKKLFSTLKSRYNVYIFLHSCGSISPIIPDLIDVGVDILNPVQVSAKGMDTLHLKKQYGDYVTFNGGIDTQYVLPSGTPAEVRDEVYRRISDLSNNGGYILSPVHCIQPDVPPQNIIAMLEAVNNYYG